MARARTQQRTDRKGYDDRQATPVTVSIGPIPEWNHLGLSSLVPNKRLLLVPSQDTDCLSIVDLEGLYVAKTVQLPEGSAPWNAKATPDGRRALVSYSRFEGHVDHTYRGDSAVGVIDLESGELVGEVPVMGGPVMLEIDEKRNRAYVTNRFSDTASVIDLGSKELGASSNIATIKTGAAPFWIKLTPEQDVLVIGNFEDASLSFIDPDSYETLNTVPVGTPLTEPFPEFGVGDTIGFSITRDRIAYVANWRSHSIAVVDVDAAIEKGRRGVLAVQRTVRFPFHIELDEEVGLIVVGSYDVPENRLVVFETIGQDAERASLGPKILDVPVNGTALPKGRAAEVNYWMSQPFESRIIGYLGQGLGVPNPDLVALVL